MVALTSVEALSSPSPIIAAFSSTAGANVPAGDVDDDKLDDNEDVGEGEERIEDENHDRDDQLVNKSKLQQSSAETIRPIIPKPQGGGRCAIKLVNMAVQIQSRYQQLCHQFERGSTLSLLLDEDGANLNG
uniref:Uncharacterized protein n=1 Tax=Hyaloperonospora arabidopsidis (strain Emoy2) TaxID=559515 RepID=M4BLP8_HYAAE